MPEPSRYRTRVSAGLCGSCGGAPLEPATTKCAPCHRKAARASAALRAERTERGRCPTCGARPEEGRRHCRPCLDRYAAFQRSYAAEARS
jgi:hypothetical protein